MDTLAGIADNLVQNADGLWVTRDQRAISYPAEGNETCFAIEEGSFWFNHRNKVIVRLIEAFPPHGPVFDVGGGNGYVSMAIRQAGFETVVIEPGPDGARNAMRRGLPVVVRSTLEDAGFRPASVAAFGLFDVLEHVEADRAFLDRLYTHLQPGGLLFLTVPAFPLLWSYDDEYAGHYRRYTTASLARCLREAGFAVPYVSYFFFVLAPALLLFRALPSRLGLRRSISAEETERDHRPPSGLAGRLLEQGLALELGRIAQGKRIPLGSSCIAVAQKPSGPA